VKLNSNSMQGNDANEAIHKYFESASEEDQCEFADSVLSSKFAG